VANPILNDKNFDKAARAGWAAPAASTQYGRSTPIPGAPMHDGPISPWTTGGTMTVSGTATATGVLFVLLLAAAAVGWSQTHTTTGQFPGLALVGVAIGFVCVIVMMFKPMWARVIAPIYALAEGFFVGVISKAFNDYQHGIVVQAAGATIATFVVMLVLYRTQVIKVTDRFRRIIVGATLGVMALYLVSFVISLVAGRQAVGFLNSPSALGIGFSVFVCVLAAMNLALDFDFIERGVKAGMPKGMEWYAAFGLMVTIVWLYLEILRLLAKMNQRR
jgi:uncharacterized YccA/Bax inhibitor family protein